MEHQRIKKHRQTNHIQTSQPSMWSGGRGSALGSEGREKQGIVSDLGEGALMQDGWRRGVEDLAQSLCFGPLSFSPKSKDSPFMMKSWGSHRVEVCANVIHIHTHKPNVMGAMEGQSYSMTNNLGKQPLTSGRTVVMSWALFYWTKFARGNP